MFSACFDAVQAPFSQIILSFVYHKRCKNHDLRPEISLSRATCSATDNLLLLIVNLITDGDVHWAKTGQIVWFETFGQ